MGVLLKTTAKNEDLLALENKVDINTADIVNIENDLVILEANLIDVTRAIEVKTNDSNIVLPAGESLVTLPTTIHELYGSFADGGFLTFDGTNFTFIKDGVFTFRYRATLSNAGASGLLTVILKNNGVVVDFRDFTVITGQSTIDFAFTGSFLIDDVATLTLMINSVELLEIVAVGTLPAGLVDVVQVTSGTDLSFYYTKSETDALLNDKADRTDLDNYYTKTEADERFAPIGGGGGGSSVYQVGLTNVLLFGTSATSIVFNTVAYDSGAGDFTLNVDGTVQATKDLTCDLTLQFLLASGASAGFTTLFFRFLKNNVEVLMMPLNLWVVQDITKTQVYNFVINNFSFTSGEQLKVQVQSLTIDSDRFILSSYNNTPPYTVSLNLKT